MSPKNETLDLAIETKEVESGLANQQFGQFLRQQGLVSSEDIEQALDEQRQNGGRIGDVLVRQEKVMEADMLRALAEYLNMDYLPLQDMTKIDRDLARSLPESIARRFYMLPVSSEDNQVSIMMADPLDVVAIDTAMMRLKCKIRPAVAPRQIILDAIETVFHGSDVEERRLRDLIETELPGDGESVIVSDEVEYDNPESEEHGEANEAPVVQFVDLLLRQAVKSQASDIHIEPEEESTLVRMRIDGKLRYMVPPPKRMRNAVTARVKILAGMDIAERRLPQDGRLKIRVSGRDIDVRVSVIPIVHGEKVVMRILDAGANCRELDQLGLSPMQLTCLKETLSLPHGIIIVTGPTGSGKSTTLYSGLNFLKDPTKNITTVEDPVEYQLPGINQIQVKSEIGLTFAASLRAILRQDPDIVLIGEIRDKETVDIAVKASLTGHLVLSTFHTNDTPSAISRLSYMGIERYLLASTMNLILAQRLVRRICEHCKEPTILPESTLERLHITLDQVADGNVCHGRGCGACGGTGYSGRLPIFEFLPIDDDMRELIVNAAPESEMRACAKEKGWGVLLDSGIRATLNGLTTAEEAISVAYTAHS